MKTVIWHSCKSLLLGGLLLSAAGCATAQLNYAFNTFYGTYTSTTTGTVIMPDSTDEALSAALNIGFTFTYDCNDYTQFRVSSNGWISLGTMAAGPLPVNTLTTTGQGPLLAPLWDDLAVSSAIPGNINYELSGTAPNRVLTVEWLLMKWVAASPGPVMSFQVKLYESSNIIEFVYQREINTIWYGSASVGISGGTIPGDFYSVSGPAAAPAATYGIENDTVRTRPRGGRVYRWIPVKSCTPSPGGINGMAFWVEANAGTSTVVNGAALAGWNDQSGNNRHAVTPGAANSPAYYDNSADNINFNPVVRFNDAGQNPAAASYMDIPVNGILSAGNNPYAVYAVLKPGASNLATPGKFLFAGNAGTNNANAFDVRAGYSFADTWMANDQVVNNSWTVNYPALASFDFDGVQRQLFVSGAPAGVLPGGGRSSANANNALGCLRAAATEFYDGGIAEIITYPNTSHTMAVRNKVESYLGIKYGITLQHDYWSSAGAVVWSRTQDPAYNTNITGIARDDSSALLQRQSKSTDPVPDILTLYIGPSKTINNAANTGVFTGGDQSFFMAANNNDPYLFPNGGTVETPPGICCRLRREWLSQQTNFNNTDLVLEFDFNIITPGYAPLNPADLRLLADDDGDFTNALVLGAPAVTITVVASVVTVSAPAANFIATPYFTLASVSMATALPVQVSGFTAECKNNTVRLGWTKRAGPPNSFVIERSADGIRFAALDAVQSAATGVQTFEWTDRWPLPGAAYYRLKIAEQPSAPAYTSIVSVSSCGAGSLRLDTDPVSGRPALFLQLRQNSTVSIGLYDIAGRRLDMAGLTGRRVLQQGAYRLPVGDSRLAAGMYFLSVGMNGNNHVFRVLVR